MIRRTVAALLFCGASATMLAAGRAVDTIPRPHGWIGTTEGWAQGLGIAFAVLDLLVLLYAWRTLRRTGESPASKQLLFGAIAVLPLGVVFFAYYHGLEASKSVEACGACHVMTPFVADLRNPKSDTLAATHYKNRYIQENHCYTCHSDYGMFGTVSAKLAGLGHVYYNLTDTYPRPIKIRQPYSNLRCLSCHGGAQNFLAKHETEEIPKLMAGKDSCLDCHGPAHTPLEIAPAPAAQAAK